MVKPTLEEILTAFTEAVDILQSVVPEKAHEGSCTTESGCDGLCMEHHAAVEQILRFRKLIKEARNGLENH